MVIAAVIEEDAYRQQMQDLAHSSKFDLDDFYVQLKVLCDDSDC